VAVRPIDVNASEWDCTLEPDRESLGGLALRLGLRMAAGLAEAEGRAVAKARRTGNGAPFASVEEVARRAGVGRRALEALAAADAFAGMAAPRRAALWQASGIERIDDLPLFQAAITAAALGDDGPLLPEPDPGLPPQREGEAVVEDYTATGLTLRAHPLALLRPALHDLGLADTRRLAAVRPGSWVRLPGLVLMRQRPGTAKGIVFVTVEDEFGSANLVVYPDVGARDRAALIGARLLVAEGRVERETEHAEVPIIHLICRRLLDRSDLLDGLLTDATGDRGHWGERALGRADEVRRPEPGSAGASPHLPRSRDFR
jgi:error-prone DNA polymerase